MQSFVRNRFSVSLYFNFFTNVCILYMPAVIIQTRHSDLAMPQNSINGKAKVKPWNQISNNAAQTLQSISFHTNTLTFPFFVGCYYFCRFHLKVRCTTDTEPLFRYRTSSHVVNNKRNSLLHGFSDLAYFPHVIVHINSYNKLQNST